MLQFIILGYVPGTSVQLTFYAVMLAFTGIVSLFVGLKLTQYHNAQRKFASLMAIMLKKQLRIWQRQNTFGV